MKQTKLLFKSPTSQIYLESDGDGKNVQVVKILNSPHPSAELVSQFLNEYELTKNIAVPGVRKALQKTKVQNQDALILEYVDGVTMEEYMDIEKPSLKEKLGFLISLAGTVDGIHQQGIIHKDLNPRNILIAKDKSVKIIDFGNSTKLNIKMLEMSNPKRLEGTLAYISPEQTGRMNRVVDFRSDLYSIGIIMYRILTGRLPFENKDALELVHCHIARNADPVSSVNPEIPPVLSAIVEKLMSKNAEDRYQSASGLKYDLELCLQNLTDSGHINDFELQQNDVSGRLLFPDKLYGREQEIDDLMAAFRRASDGYTELVTVSGYSGIGKSALINELHQPVTTGNGRFISGKFDQLQRSIPHYAFINGVEQLVDNLLTHDEEDLRNIKTNILDAVGDNGGVLTSAIPSLELLIGKQDPAPALPPIEAQNRFNWTFEQFIYAIASKDSPLVIFVDDMQWADPASLDLLNALATSLHGKYLLLICAYRSNEVNSDHPLTKTLESIEASRVPITKLELRNLSEKALNELISDALHCGPWYAEELSKIVFHKTKGNCFYALELLKSLYREDILRFDHDRKAWVWDAEEIAKKSVSENVGELLAEKAAQYSPQTQKVLKIAACVGNTFDLKILSKIHGKNYSETLSDLWKIMEDGWIIPMDTTYKYVGVGVDAQGPNPRFRFSHDRVQEVATQLLPNMERSELNLSIGRAMLNDSTLSREEVLFEIANQFSLAEELLTDPKERATVCEINIEAAGKAESSAAFVQAQSYAETAIRLLPDNSWENNYEQTFTVYKLTAMTNFVIGNFERSKALIDEATNKAKTTLERAECLDLLLTQYMFSFEWNEALETGRKALEMLGISFPDKDLQPIIMGVNGEIQGMLQNMSFDAILEMDDMTDPEKMMAMRILGNVGPPTFVMGRLEEWSHSVLISVKLSLESGNSIFSPYAYVQYGMILGFYGQYMPGYLFGEMACKLSEKWGKASIDQKARTHFIMAEYIQPWVKPFSASEQQADIALQTAIECGNNLFRGYVDVHRVFGRFYQGVNLEILEKYVDRCIRVNQKNKHGQAVNAISGIKSFIDHLTHEGNDVINEVKEKSLESSLSFNDIFSVLQFYVFECEIRCIEGDYEAARSAYLESKKYIVGKGLLGIEAPQLFYGSLATIKLAQATKDEAARAELMKEFGENMAQLEVWVGTCPANFKNKHSLLTAEQCVLEGKPNDAIVHFKNAIQESATNNFLSEQALCNELAGKYYESRDDEFVAISYLTEAHYLYEKWGAKRKYVKLSEQYAKLPQSAAKSAIDATFTETSTTRNTSTGSVKLDLKSLIKASEAISSEIHFDKMVHNLLSVAVENAGARRGIFIRNAKREQLIYGMFGYESTPPLPVSTKDDTIVPASVINYVSQKRMAVILDNAKTDPRFMSDPYFIHGNSQSVMCMPILNLGDLVGILYLENDLVTGAFDESRVELLKMLSGQIAVSLENSILYQNLEQKVAERTHELAAEKAKSDELLLNILPAKVASELKEYGKAKARRFENVSVMFSDISGFTSIASQLAPEELVSLLDTYFRNIDEIIAKYGLEKIKTIGDAYMCVGGLPTEDPNNAEKMIRASFDILDYLETLKQKQIEKNQPYFKIRIGIHTGPVIAGVVGKSKFAYDVWGETVNVAARFETTGDIGKVNVSEDTIKQAGDVFNYISRGKVAIKNAGEMEMFFVELKD